MDVAVSKNDEAEVERIKTRLQQLEASRRLQMKDAKAIPDAGQKQATIDNLNTMDRAITKLDNAPAALEAYKNMSTAAAPGMAPPAPPSM